MILHQFFSKMISPKWVFTTAGKLLPWAMGACIITLVVGTVTGLFIAPIDYQQGDAYRIMFLHVPAATLSLAIYTLMSVCATIYLIWRVKIAAILMQESASIGAMFTLITLLTGAIWGKPMWGTWWIWDARLTSELILLFIYLSIMILQNSLKDHERQWMLVAIWVLIGFVDIPIIHFSVQWWATLHQGYSITVLERPKIAPAMLYPLAIMWLAFISYFCTMMLYKIRYRLLYHERHASWAQKALS